MAGDGMAGNDQPQGRFYGLFRGLLGGLMDIRPPYRICARIRVRQLSGSDHFGQNLPRDLWSGQGGAIAVEDWGRGRLCQGAGNDLHWQAQMARFC